MIVTFGDAIVDLFALPIGSDVASAETFVPRQGGAPANVAVVAARIGGHARFVGALGRDAHGDRLAQALENAGVDVSCVVRVPQRTGVTFVRVGLDGTRSFLFYRHGGADLSLERESITALPGHPLDGAHWLQLSSSILVAEPLATAARDLLDAARDRGVPVSLDLNVRAHLWPDRDAMVSSVRWLCSRACVVKSSEEDLAALGLAPTLASLAALAPDAVPVLTLAERGAEAAVREGTVRSTAPAVRVADATGAGDAFVAAMLAALDGAAVRPGTAAFASARVWQAVLSFACAVGARAVTDVGATEAFKSASPERTALSEIVASLATAP